MKWKTFNIPDLQFRWASKAYLNRIFNAIKREKPDVINQMGDLYEFYYFARFSRDLNICTPEIELKKSQEDAYSFWETIHKIAPKAKKNQILGNHDMRLIKRIYDKFPEFSSIVDIKEHFYDFKNVNVLKSDRDYIIIDDVVYCHGWATRRWAHVTHFDKSVVHAHTHRPNLLVKQDEKTDYRMLFELDCGNCINDKALPFQYTMSKVTRWKKAYGIVDKGVPRLIML